MNEQRPNYLKMKHTCGQASTFWSYRNGYRPHPDCEKCQMRVKLNEEYREERKRRERGYIQPSPGRLPNLSELDEDFS